MKNFVTCIVTLALAFALIGCNGDGESKSADTVADSMVKPRGEAKAAGPHAKPGFVTEVEDGRLWVFRPDNTEKSDKHVTLIGAGPLGMTIKSPEKDIALAYLASKPGFQVEIEDGRLWVWKAGEEKKHSDKHTTLIGAGPARMTVKALEKDTALLYLAAKPGFVTEIEDGRLWVFKAGESTEKSDKHATLIGAGPAGMTVKALDKQTAVAYLAAKDGFVTKLDDDGRLWVFKQGGDMEMSEKHVTRVGAGPMGLTLKALDSDTLNTYLR